MGAYGRGDNDDDDGGGDGSGSGGDAGGGFSGASISNEQGQPISRFEHQIRGLLHRSTGRVERSPGYHLRHLPGQRPAVRTKTCRRFVDWNDKTDHRSCKYPFL